MTHSEQKAKSLLPILLLKSTKEIMTIQCSKPSCWSCQKSFPRPAARRFTATLTPKPRHLSTRLWTSLPVMNGSVSSMNCGIRTRILSAAPTRTSLPSESHSRRTRNSSPFATPLSRRLSIFWRTDLQLRTRKKSQKMPWIYRIFLLTEST